MNSWSGDTFWPKDAQVILTIQTNEDINDWSAWHYDPKGLFSVKSTYKLSAVQKEHNKNRDASTSGSSSSTDEGFDWMKNLGHECLEQDFKELEKMGDHTRVANPISWEAPPTDVYKVNVDAAYRASMNDGGWGFVARGSDGSFLAGECGKLGKVSSVLQAEALSAFFALEGGRGMGIIILESGDGCATVGKGDDFI
uniref:RNase H type-1 domain-containing protein n=1 Tax=Leersia perrieri TaxID=77586 RepID=A0A0D9VSV7_9ORYZ